MNNGSAATLSPTCFIPQKLRFPATAAPEDMIGVLLAKGIADLSFGGALLWYVVKYIVSAALAVAAVMLGIRLRKNKNAKTEQLAVDKESAHGN